MVGTRSTAFDWSIENTEDFKRQIDRMGAFTGDFRIPFRLIASDFYRSNRKLFTLQGAGLYQDLAPARGQDGNPTTTSNYKKNKRKKGRLRLPYPGRKFPRFIEFSFKVKAPATRSFFLNRKELQIGSSVPYGKYHQSDGARSKIPQRKFVFIDGGPSDRSSDSSINGRRERWTSIISTHVDQIITGRIR